MFIKAIIIIIIIIIIILKNQLYFVSAVVHISRIWSAVCHCACNPLSQNTTAHITTVTMDDIICLGHRSHRAFFAFSSYFNRLLSANSTQYKSFRVELKMANSKWTYWGKNRAFISFFDAVSCYLIQVYDGIRKKGNLDVMKLNESCHKWRTYNQGNFSRSPG